MPDDRWPAGMLKLPPGPPLEDAACKGSDLDLFFPRRGRPAGPALAVCGTCPGADACRAWAIGAPTALRGIWGGLSEKQRRRLRAAQTSRGDDGGMDDGPEPVLADADDDDNDGATMDDGVILEAPSNNGHVAPDPVTATEPRLCAGPGCDQELTGRQERFCSRNCAKKESYARSGRPARTPTVKQPSSAAAIRIDPTAVLASAGFELTGYLLTDSGGQPWMLTSLRTPGG